MRIDNAGVGIHVEVGGPDDGVPVVLLHGFPDTGRLWDHQVEALTGAGYRVIVPDQRGYGRSDQPADVADYRMRFLVTDVTAIIDQLALGRAHLVGHDFGASVAWVVASLVPDRVDHLAVLSVGHPAAFRSAGIDQRQKSWYMLLFQFEDVAEEWLSADGWANFRTWARHPRTDAVVDELEASGSLTPGLNWYRANAHPRILFGPPPTLPPVTAPTMGVWSSADLALTEKQMTDSARFVTGPWRYERLDGPGHWMPLEAPDDVNRLLLDFLKT